MKIGWIGTGVMGNSMCAHLIKKGYNAFVYNRTESKTQFLASLGAKVCSSPAEVSNNSDIIFSIVGYPADVKDIYLGDNGVLAGARHGSNIIDMTTSTPALAEKIYKEAKNKNIGSLDAPVSGGDIGAKEATLSIMVGGDEETFNKILPLFKLLGKNIALMGGPGKGQHTKMSNQIVIASTMVGVVEGLLYAQKAGLDQNKLVDIIGQGAAASFSLNNLGRRIINKNFDPGFFIKHFIKDMGIALEEARRMNLSLPGLALANQLYISASAIGLENLGTQALYKALSHINSVKGD
ncbi:MAG TPA: oxidoreductase [Lentisphaeria bacterium]|nr:MAG: oxidoreductase [Lentisphaerae bacterium GWF2_38_69]HBM14977.1 oxidoreductase [Lentisphaeria bacterium]